MFGNANDFHLDQGSLCFVQGGTYHFRVLFVVAFVVLSYVFPLYSWTQWHGGFVYLRGFQRGLVNRMHAPKSCIWPLYFLLYVCTHMLRVLGFLFVRVL